jgi:membrane protein
VLDAARAPAGRQHLHHHPAGALRAVARRLQRTGGVAGSVVAVLSSGFGARPAAAVTEHAASVVARLRRADRLLNGYLLLVTVNQRGQRALSVVRRLVVDVMADLRGRDIPLAAAGLTFYATVAFVPLLLVALWLASLVLGGSEIRSLGQDLATTVGTRHGLDRGVRQLTDAGSRAQVPALVTAALIATLYGEGLTRALARLGLRGGGRPAVPRPGRRLRGVLRGRLTAPLLVAMSGVLVGGGLVLAAWLSSALGTGDKATVLGVYLAFLVVWVGATANVLLCYRVFGPLRPRLGPLLWGAAGAGSWIAGSTLGFLLVLNLPVNLGRPFAGSDAIGTAALLIFWLYFSHIAVLLGYAVSLRLSAGPRSGRGPEGPAQEERDRPDVEAGPRPDPRSELALRS